MQTKQMLNNCFQMKDKPTRKDNVLYISLEDCLDFIKVKYKIKKVC